MNTVTSCLKASPADLIMRNEGVKVIRHIRNLHNTERLLNGQTIKYKRKHNFRIFKDEQVSNTETDCRPSLLGLENPSEPIDGSRVCDQTNDCKIPNLQAGFKTVDRRD
jgi:hypothetical protein